MYYKSAYFFDSKVFSEFEMEFIELEKIYRQTDNKFINILNKIRNNTAEWEDINNLNERYDEFFKIPKDDFYIQLTTTNANADVINSTELEKLPTDTHTFV
jgi:ATP-dependent DNA helicase PIF1